MFDKERVTLRRFAILVAVIGLVLWLPASVAASPPGKLAGQLPDGNKLVMGVEMASLKKSPLYAEGMKWLKANTRVGGILDFLQADGGFDVDNDLASIVLVSPNIPENVSDADAFPFSLAMAGKYSKEKIIGAAKKKFPNLTERKEGKLVIMTADRDEFAFTNASTLVLVSGPDTYRHAAWKAIAAGNDTANKDAVALQKGLGSAQSLWVTMDLAETAQSGGPQAKAAALGLGMVSGIQLTMLSQMNSEEGAKQAAEEMETLKAESMSNPMVALMGLTPLVTNLVVKQEGSNVRATSSMNEAQSRGVFTRLQRMAQQSEALKKGGMKAPAPQAPATGAGDDAPNRVKVQPGAPVDFN